MVTTSGNVAECHNAFLADRNAGIEAAKVVDVLDAGPLHHLQRGIILDVQGHPFDQFVDHRRKTFEHPFQMFVETASLLRGHVVGSDRVLPQGAHDCNDSSYTIGAK